MSSFVAALICALTLPLIIAATVAAIHRLEDAGRNRALAAESAEAATAAPPASSSLGPAPFLPNPLAPFGLGATGPVAITVPPASTPEPAQDDTASGTPPVAPGQYLQVKDLAGDDCVNVRSAPSLSADAIRCLPSRSMARILDGPKEADGHRWWKLDAGGWAADDNLVAAGGTPNPRIEAGDSLAAALGRASFQTSAQSAMLYGFAGFATYYGIEDGFVRGDIMNDGTPYDPADPTITAASFRIPMHTMLRVCTEVHCILVQVRDRGLLDENGIMLDLSRAAYALLFGGLNGKRWVSAYFVGPAAAAAPLAAPAAPPAPSP
jgi:rare lipoprotein A (peptidoglycan hydrolase)